MIVFHDPRSAEYCAPGHPECPTRVTTSAQHLQAVHPDWEWRQPNEASEEQLLRAHSVDHLRSVRAAKHDFDADTPAHENVFAHAARASGAA
ncbi:MAG: histone deacetylase, partial [Chthoniobacterales bacterium]